MVKSWEKFKVIRLPSVLEVKNTKIDFACVVNFSVFLLVLVSFCPLRKIRWENLKMISQKYQLHTISDRIIGNDETFGSIPKKSVNGPKKK